MNLDFNFNQISHPTINSIEDIDQFGSDFVLLGVSDSEGGTAVTINKALLRGIIQAGNYNQLTNKPSINNVEIKGSHDAAYYHLASDALATKSNDGLMSKEDFAKLGQISLPASDINFGCIKLGRNLFIDNNESSQTYGVVRSSDAYFNYQSLDPSGDGSTLTLLCEENNQMGIAFISNFSFIKKPSTLILQPLAARGDILGHNNKCLIINDIRSSIRVAPLINLSSNVGKMFFTSNKEVIISTEGTKYLILNPNEVAIVSYMFWNEIPYFSMDIQIGQFMNSEVLYSSSSISNSGSQSGQESSHEPNES